jgi:hypothetical protein
MSKSLAPVSEFSIVPSAGTHFAAVLAALAVFAATRYCGAHGATSLALPLAVGWCLVYVGFAQTVTLYADGVEVRRGSRRDRVLFAQTRSIAAGPDGQTVALVLDDGTVLALRAPPSEASALAAELAARFHAYTESACALMPELMPPAEHARALSWMHALRRDAETPGAPYRAAMRAPDSLWRIVESPSAPAGIRVGAAVALSSHFDDTSRDRICTVARGCSEPALRASLRAVAAGEDERLADEISRLG